TTTSPNCSERGAPERNFLNSGLVSFLVIVFFFGDLAGPSKLIHNPKVSWHRLAGALGFTTVSVYFSPDGEVSRIVPGSPRRTRYICPIDSDLAVISSSRSA